MPEISSTVIIVFIITTLLSIYLFNRSNQNKTSLLIIVIWTAIQGILGYLGFYLNFESTPPRFVLLIAPTILFIIYIFNSKKGKGFLDHLDHSKLIWLHIVRIPVELILYQMALSKLIPESMTYAGQNFDIIAGISAPIIYFLYYKKQFISKRLLIGWNIAMLGLLFNIVITAVISAPLPFQILSFDQPNIGVMYFPFIWLPGIIVPLVMIAHFANLRKLIYR